MSDLEVNKLVAQVAYLTQEVEFIKKNYLSGKSGEVAMYMNGSPQTRYEIIAETISQDNNLLNISYLCELAGVSRSGFYYWQKSKVKREAAEKQDIQDFELVLEAFNYRGYAKGARGIHMRLLHQNPPIVMNLKKIRRLMKKFNLRCPVRKVNPYRKQAKRLQGNRVAPNILNRQFRAYGLGRTPEFGQI